MCAPPLGVVDHACAAVAAPGSIRGESEIRLRGAICGVQASVGTAAWSRQVAGDVGPRRSNGCRHPIRVGRLSLPLATRSVGGASKFDPETAGESSCDDPCGGGRGDDARRSRDRAEHGRGYRAQVASALRGGRRVGSAGCSLQWRAHGRACGELRSSA